MPDNTATPLSRDEILTLLLKGLDTYLPSVTQIIGVATAMAEAIGGDTAAVFTALLREHARHHHLVRVSHRALRDSAAPHGGNDGT